MIPISGYDTIISILRLADGGLWANVGHMLVGLGIATFGTVAEMIVRLALRQISLRQISLRQA